MREREIDRGQTFLEGKDWTGGALRRATSGVGERFRACRGLWNVGRGGGTVKHPNRETAVESHTSKNEEWGTRRQNSLPVNAACARDCLPRSLPPTQAIGSANAISARGYQWGPNVGPWFHVTTVPQYLRQGDQSRGTP